jgi:Flp pilus assembly protein TadB
MEYPVLVDMLNLYMGAGLTVKGALSRIADNNETILGEEIRYALNEIKSGVPEGESYYRLGHRLNLPVYLKLMSLLSQNVKKGTRDILDMLMAEEDQALQLRKELAKKKGEEASTKLLFPMILLLATVMLIIVMPVFLSF